MPQPFTVAEIREAYLAFFAEKGCVRYPSASLVDGKYWPPVGRVDNVYGDRNLVCACPSIEAYQDA